MNKEEIKEIVFVKGDLYFQALFADIAQAKQTIDLEIYMFANDTLGQKIAQLLVAAAQRGVAIRILVDGAGTVGWNAELYNLLHSVGIKTRVFNPFPWRIWQWRHSISRVPFMFKLFYYIASINKRNHRKVWVIDKKIVYLGSANISSCHLSSEQEGGNWRDTVVKLMHVDTTELTEAFNSAWDHTPLQKRLQLLFQPVNKHPIIRLNNTRHRRRLLYKNLLKRLSLCRRRVWITNAYFIPDNFLLRKLKELAKANVDVRILLPKKSDVPMMPWASATFYESLLKEGVRIFVYIPSMLHAKSLILDDWFLVGSSNLNHRSLLHDLEVDVSIFSPEAKKLLEEQFIVDQNLAEEIKLPYKHKQPWYERILGRLLLYLKYWM